MSGKEILIADDKSTITNLLKKSLELEGHKCTVCNDGKNSLNLIHGKKFDVILLDLMMPGFGGFDVINELEKTNEVSNNNIFVFTAADVTPQTVEGLLQKGIKSCIMKPIKMDTLKKITGLS